MARLKEDAAARGHSLQAEIRAVLTGSSQRSLAVTRRLSARWLAELTTPPGDGRSGQQP